MQSKPQRHRGTEKTDANLVPHKYFVIPACPESFPFSEGFRTSRNDRKTIFSLCLSASVVEVFNVFAFDAVAVRSTQNAFLKGTWLSFQR